MSRAKLYWDSDCFLGYLLAEEDKVGLCEAVLQEASEGRVLIVTSALTITEVLNLKGRPPVPKENKNKVLNLFRSEYIAVRGVTRKVAELAREVVWENGIKPKDSIHIATALDAGLNEFNTFDGELLKKSSWVVSPSKLLICRPRGPVQPRLPFDKVLEDTSVQ